MNCLCHRVERVCTKDFNNNGVDIKKGMIIAVPAFPLHYDEEYYPEPDRFNPDRYTPQWVPLLRRRDFLMLTTVSINKVGCWQSNQAKSLRFHAVRNGPKKLHWNAIRHGGNENCPLLNGEKFPILPSCRNTGKNEIQLSLDLDQLDFQRFVKSKMISLRKRCSLKMGLLLEWLNQSL